MEGLPRGGIRAVSSVGDVREFGGSEPSGEIPRAPRKATDAEKIQLLEKALDRYRDVIVRLSQQLDESETQRLRADARIEAITKQLDELKKQLHQ